jgi:hypothetical protein
LSSLLMGLGKKIGGICVRTHARQIFEILAEKIPFDK